jgi:hypothetical protein
VARHAIWQAISAEDRRVNGTDLLADRISTSYQDGGLMEIKRNLKTRFAPDISPSALMLIVAGLAVAALMLASRPAMLLADEIPVAIGDGFVVTKADVDELEAFTAAHNFASTGEEYRKAALKLRLFSMEAEALGLGSGESMQGQTLQDSVKVMYDLYERYVDKLVEDYPVSDIAIKSYYLANPEKFRKPVAVAPESEFYPLDKSLKKKIRLKIAAARKPVLVEQAFERLKEKYHVIFPVKGAGK